MRTPALQQADQSNVLSDLSSARCSLGINALEKIHAGKKYPTPSMPRSLVRHVSALSIIGTRPPHTLSGWSS